MEIIVQLRGGSWAGDYELKFISVKMILQAMELHPSQFFWLQELGIFLGQLKQKSDNTRT